MLLDAHLLFYFCFFGIGFCSFGTFLSKTIRSRNALGVMQPLLEEYVLINIAAKENPLKLFTIKLQN